LIFRKEKEAADMADYVTLLGAEDVKSAANLISTAAYDMNRAASSMSETARLIAVAFEQHQVFMNDWLERMNGVLQDRTHDISQSVR
jgi:hypothetical protein